MPAADPARQRLLRGSTPRLAHRVTPAPTTAADAVRACAATLLSTGSCGEQCACHLVAVCVCAATSNQEFENHRRASQASLMHALRQACAGKTTTVCIAGCNACMRALQWGLVLPQLVGGAVGHRPLYVCVLQPSRRGAKPLSCRLDIDRGATQDSGNSLRPLVRPTCKTGAVTFGAPVAVTSTHCCCYAARCFIDAP